MWDPEDRQSYGDKQKKEEPQDNKLRLPVTCNTNEQELFNWYFRNSTQVREAYGIGKNAEGNPVIADQKKLDSLREWEKDKVRIAWKAWNKK